MIAFITINSGLVPLIEGLCAQILYFRFEIVGGLRVSFDMSRLIDTENSWNVMHSLLHLRMSFYTFSPLHLKNEFSVSMSTLVHYLVSVTFDTRGVSQVWQFPLKRLRPHISPSSDSSIPCGINEMQFCFNLNLYWGMWISWFGRFQVWGAAFSVEIVIRKSKESRRRALARPCRRQPKPSVRSLKRYCFASLLRVSTNVCLAHWNLTSRRSGQDPDSRMRKRREWIEVRRDEMEEGSYCTDVRETRRGETQESLPVHALPLCRRRMREEIEE